MTKFLNPTWRLVPRPAKFTGRFSPCFAVLLLLTSLLTCPPLSATEKTLSADEFFQLDRVIEVSVTLAPEDWETLTGQTRGFGTAFQDPSDKPFSYFKADITVDGKSIPSVGIRKKGFIGSLDDYRPSLKIKFDEYVDQDPIAGLDRLTLNNNKQDYSLVSQYLTYDTFRKAGVHAPRVGFARVTVNGEYLGVYSNVESVRDPFLKQAFGDDSGDLFEGTLSDLYPKAIDRIEVKRGKDDTVNRLLPLAELLAADGELDLARVSEIVDVPYFLKFLAVESLIGFWDGYANNQNNYFIYIHPENQRFYFVPWGADGAFDSGRGMMRRMANVESTAVYVNAMLANRLFWAGNTSEQYEQTLKAVMDKAWNELDLMSAIERIDKLVSPHLHEIQRADHRESLDQVNLFVLNRRDQINHLLAAGWDSVPRTPRKPMYTIQVGSAEGSFSTSWSDDLPRNPGSDGTVNLKLLLDGEPVEFTNGSADAGPMAFRGFGGRGGPGEDSAPPVNIRLAGRNPSDNEPIVLSLMIDHRRFETAKDSVIEVNGFLQQGRQGFGFGGRGGMRSIVGTMKLDSVGTQAGDQISGEVNLEIIETRGGMFNRR